MNIHWTEPAIADRRSIERYIAQHSRQYASSMIDKTALLADHPFFGSMVPEYEYEGLRELLVEPYRINYRIMETRCDILAVVHSARQLPPLA